MLTQRTVFENASFEVFLTESQWVRSKSTFRSVYQFHPAGLWFGTELSTGTFPDRCRGVGVGWDPISMLFSVRWLLVAGFGGLQGWIASKPLLGRCSLSREFGVVPNRAVVLIDIGVDRLHWPFIGSIKDLRGSGDGESAGQTTSDA
jgi:hypothetical protein